MRLIAAISIVAALTMNVARAQTFEFEETDDIRLYYQPIQAELEPYVLKNFYNSLEFQENVLGWKPWEQVHVTFYDISDYGNASARSAPQNGLNLQISPLSTAYETYPLSERFYTLFNHELVHVATMDAWNNQDKFWRRFFFGKPRPDRGDPITILYNYLTTPRMTVPSWYLEGTAVFFETWMAGGIGRAQGGYDEMVFRSMVRDDTKFYSALGLVSEGTHVDFQAGVNNYLYGARFINYLALAYSPESVIQWIQRGDDSKAYYESQFKYVFGKSLPKVWDDWIVWEKQFQTENLELVRQNPVTHGERLADQALGSISRVYYDEQKNSLIGGFLYPGVVAHLGELQLDSGKIRHIRDIKGPMLYRVTSLAMNPERSTAWYTTDNSLYRDLVELDVATGKSKVLMKDARIGDLVYNNADQSLWGVRHRFGITSIMRIAPPYTDADAVRILRDFRYYFYDIDVSPDGTMLAGTLGRPSGAQQLQVFKIADLLEKGEKAEPFLTYIPEKNRAGPEGLAFSPDGKYIYGSSYESGTSNIFRLDLETGSAQIVSNAETGYFRPIPLADGSLIVFEYTGEGFVPVRINAEASETSLIRFMGTEVQQEHPVVETWAVANPNRLSLDGIDREHKDYHPFSELGLGSAYPIIEGYRGGTAVGYRFNVEDPLRQAQFDLSISYSVSGDIADSEKLHIELGYENLNWHFQYWHNIADFYDLFGPSKRARKGDAVLAGYTKDLINDAPRSLTASVDFGYFTGLDILPDNQNVAFSLNEIVSGQLAIEYSNRQTALGSVSYEKGFRGELVLASDYTSSMFATKILAGVDVGFSLPIKNSSLWFYNSAGLSFGKDDNPLNSFYFGGFKNNYVDDGSIQRYRQFHTMPGFEIDEIPATNFAKTTAEWNLPPIRLAEVGTPSFFLGYLRPSIFSSVLYADTPTDERVLYNVGGQLDLRFTVSHRLPMTLSVGYALGLGEDIESKDEFMISLKIM